MANIAYESQAALPRGDGEQAGIFTGDAHRYGLFQRFAIDGGDEVAVDLADQHHAHDLQRLGVGDAKPIAEFRLLPHAAHHHIDLGPAAMDKRYPHADRAKQQHVLRQGSIKLPVDRGAAQLHHHRLSGEAADIRQRLDEDAGSLVGVDHEVTEFSLM
jgi:hypothetical protein